MLKFAWEPWQRTCLLSARHTGMSKRSSRFNMRSVFSLRPSARERAGRSGAAEPPGGAVPEFICGKRGGASHRTGPETASGFRRSPGLRAAPSWQRRRRIPWAISQLTGAAAQAPRMRRRTVSRRRRVAELRIRRSRRAYVGTRRKSGCLDPMNCSGAWLVRPFSIIRSTNR